MSFWRYSKSYMSNWQIFTSEPEPIYRFCKCYFLAYLYKLLIYSYIFDARDGADVIGTGLAKRYWRRLEGEPEILKTLKNNNSSGDPTKIRRIQP